MTICPFISHMLGEENSTILTIDPSIVVKKSKVKSSAQKDSVVILGYDSNEEKGTKTQTATLPEKESATNLFCLKDPCRFYQKGKKECIFDSMLALLKKAPEEKANKKIPSRNDAKILKELEKLWKFQTKSVSELISHMGETHKEKKNAVAELKKSLDTNLERIAKDIKELAAAGKTNSSEVIKKQLAELTKHITDREESSENFSATLSELVLNLEESLKKRILELNNWARDWEKHLRNITEKQEELLTLFRAEKSRREEDLKRVNKKEAKTYNNLGVTCFHNGAFAQAKEQFLKAIELDPDFAEAYNNLGLAYTEMGKDEDATEAFKKATELKPDLAAVYGNLGYLLNKQGKYEEAVELYNEALGRHTSSSFAYTNLGNSYYKLGKYEKARRAWEKALEIDPSNEKANLYLKRLHSEKR